MSYRNNKYAGMKAFLIARVSDPSQIEALPGQILRLVVSNLKIQQKRLNFNLLEPFATLVDLDSRSVWCPRLDLNQHVLRHMLLRHTCIPISPLGQYSDYSTYSLFF